MPGAQGPGSGEDRGSSSVHHQRPDKQGGGWRPRVPEVQGEARGRDTLPSLPAQLWLLSLASQCPSLVSPSCWAGAGPRHPGAPGERLGFREAWGLGLADSAPV